MSLESKIEALTAAVQALTAKLESGNIAPAAPVAPAPAPVVKAVPVVAPAPVAVAPAMPVPPVFVAPVAAPAPAPSMFTDPKGLIDYVMGAYKALGPQKGASIQGVLVGLGYQNINDVKPEHYDALFSGIEALKA
tara:strand:+ start:1146 stop:1550 length:405 start_codon:yes stop_codon:yes gene_type:complete